jgi:DNA-binding NarL/FixJ family response regulator
MTEKESIRILIADDFKLLRDVIRLHLERTTEMQVVDEAPDLHDALESATRLRPDIIILNDYLPPIDSAHAAAIFRKAGSTAGILVISMQAEADLIERAFRSGVNGFMHKGEVDTHLLEAIRTIHNGGRYLSPTAEKSNGGLHA